MKARARDSIFIFAFLLSLALASDAGAAVCRDLFALSKLQQIIERAEQLGLHYSDSTAPGIQRIVDETGGRPAAGHFRYLLPNGLPLADPATLARIEALHIPPGYRNVWIALDPQSHLQATGIDSKGRKQYRYHADWSQVRDGVKFSRIAKFGEALPRLRARVARDLKGHGLTKDRVLAGLVRLLEKSLIRVGNEEYARANDSYGLTTMRKHHMTLSGNTITFAFKGKSHVEHEKHIEDTELAKLLRELKRLHGEDIFVWIDRQGMIHSIDSSDVNDYIKRAAQGAFSAKDFRTWKGTTFAIQFLAESGRPTTDEQAAEMINAAVARVAEKLGNTPAVSRESYIHPGVLNLDLKGGELEALYKKAAGSLAPGTSIEEAVALLILAP